MNTHRRFDGFVILGALAMSAAAHAQSDINPRARYAWSENCGWINFRDAGSPAGAEGVRLEPTFLAGFAWGENIGWINLGDGTPANGLNYANTTGADFGANLDPVTGHLTGMAWGENIGWIDFGGGAMASPANPARFDTIARRFRGYAWGENIGWINLDDDTHFVSTACPADFNLNGVVSVQDIFDFLAAYFALETSADFNLSGAVTVQDIFDFLAVYFAGCG
jgi:hypothetical protein